jgi:predicted transcriptional regulator
MPSDTPSEPITVRIRKQTVSEIDALAASMDRSRNYIVNEAIRQYLDANRWQIERIKEGVAAARAGQVKPAEQVYAEIAAKFGWKR